MCLLPVEVSLSLWLFHILYYAVAVVLSAMGYIGPGTFGYNAGAFGYQTGGALVGFGAFLLYQSRRTIYAAVRAWWDPRWRSDDPLELLVGLPQRIANRGLDQGPVGEFLADVPVGPSQDLVHGGADSLFVALQTLPLQPISSPP